MPPVPKPSKAERRKRRKAEKQARELEQVNSQGAYIQAKERDKYRCQFPSCGRTDIEIHHIIFRSQGGRNHIENLVCLCNSHHRGIHSPHQSKEWRRFWELWAGRLYPEYWQDYLTTR